MKTRLWFTPGVLALCSLCLLPASSRAASIARIWNNEIISAIRSDRPNPPVHARNLFHLATAMYNCWAAYDTTAIGYLHHERQTAADVEAARHKAISYAAYRVLRNRFATSVNSFTILSNLDARMAALGYPTSFTSTVGNSPEALGNRMASRILVWGLSDGSSQATGYQDFTYLNPQPVMLVRNDGQPVGGIPAFTDPNRWQPLAFDFAETQNNIAIEETQTFVGVTWLKAQPFSLHRSNPNLPWVSLPGPSRLGTATDAAYKAGALGVLEASSKLSDATLIDISPGAVGNNPLGTDNGTGHATNPVTGLPYAPNVVKRSDFARVLAEFWADGPDSETPPGHWHVLANYVTDSPGFQRRIGGTGPLLSELEWDVKMYFSLAGALHNAACAAWSVKRYYEGVRPITMIRYMASKGQCSDPGLPSYHVEGLPLKPGVVELITAASSAPGQRHHDVGSVGEIAVFSWPGEPAIPATQVSTVRWIRGLDWVPYQRSTFNTPPFPGYISGHSTFSRAAAEVLTRLTGSAFFPGGIGTFTANQNAYLVFEDGPSQTTQLQWATYYDAADQAGQSRIWGGIHVVEDDYAGRQVGSVVGISAWNLAQKYWDGSIWQEETKITPKHVQGENVLTWNTERGMYYQVQSTTDLIDGPWASQTPKLQAFDTTMTWTDPFPDPNTFYRVVRTLSP